MEFIKDYWPFLKGDIVSVYEQVANGHGNKQYLCVDEFSEVWNVAPTALKPVTTSSKDNVNSPAHYNAGTIECITYLEDTLGEGISYYLEGNIKKYLHRWRYKNGVEDLKKAKWYLERLILNEENRNEVL